jgi:hypothetical protein
MAAINKSKKYNFAKMKEASVEVSDYMYILLHAVNIMWSLGSNPTVSQFNQTSNSKGHTSDLHFGS